MYSRTATGLSGESYNMGSGQGELRTKGKFYILRPEVIETLFILHRVTGNPVYREWGWDMWVAIEAYCKTRYGYGHFPDVNNPNQSPEDHMESFFLAETLKYHYLLQQPVAESLVDLNKIVFNTEAHPIKRFRWSAGENPYQG